MEADLPHSYVHCTACGQPLAHDQRYCLHCGARRGPLPAYIGRIIGGIFEQGHGIAAAGRAAPDGPIARPRWYDDLVAAPRAAAAAVLGMLGFGAIVGSLVGAGVAGPLETLLVSRSPVGQEVSSAAGLGDSQDSGGGVQTIIDQQTITQPGAGATGGLGLALGPTGASAAAAPLPTLPTGTGPPIKHVFLIVLSGQGFQQTFGHAVNDPYLGTTLPRRGELIPNYYAVAGGSLANEIALVSGQGPTPQTVGDCPTYANLTPGRKAAKQQVLGHGCVYPKSTDSLATQLTQANYSWKVYVQTEPRSQRTRLETCAPRPGSPPPPDPSPRSPYATWRNPFLYFHSVVDPAACPKNDVSLDQLSHDLKRARTTPSLSYIVPDLCDDAGSLVCDPQHFGLAASDAFLRSVVPKIMRSPAYKADGMIAITFDQAPQSGVGADPSSCCGTPTYPNLPPPPPASTPGTGSPAGTSTGTTTTSAGGPPGLGLGQTNPTGGGGQVGLLVLSRFVQPGTQDVTDYFNHYSLLASIEDLFGLKRLGYAKDLSLPVFGPAVFSAYTGG